MSPRSPRSCFTRRPTGGPAIPGGRAGSPTSFPCWSGCSRRRSRPSVGGPCRSSCWRVCASIAIQAIGAFWYTGASDGRFSRSVPAPERCGRPGIPGTLRSSPSCDTSGPPRSRNSRTGRASEGRTSGHRPREKNDLAAAARNAAALLTSHQQAAGFWLTSYTATPRFENPRPENNTFLTSMMVDLLDAGRRGGGRRARASRARALISATRSRRAGSCATTAGPTGRPFPRSVARSRRMRTTPLSSGGSRDATAERSCRRRSRSSRNTAPARVSTAPGWRRASAMNASTPERTPTRPTPAFRCTCSCSSRRRIRRRPAALCGALQGAIGEDRSGSTTRRRLSCRCCGKPISAGRMPAPRPRGARARRGGGSGGLALRGSAARSAAERGEFRFVIVGDALRAPGSFGRRVFPRPPHSAPAVPQRFHRANVRASTGRKTSGTRSG